jgi:hypothetical protein
MDRAESITTPPVLVNWEVHRITPHSSVEPSLTLFRSTLNDAVDEIPMQTFLASHPHLLECLLPPGRDVWCWDRPRFGSESIPDFLLCTRNSIGFEWVMVELESPAVKPLTQAGLPTAKLREAQGQIQDWRIWLRDNIAYAQTQLGFQGLTAEAQAVIILGRRSAIDLKHAKKWREISTSNTRIMTYDRLIDSFASGRNTNGASSG